MTLDLAAASDGELAALALSDQQAACREIMQRHRAPLLRVIRGHIGDNDEAIDILQECFVAAFSSLGRYDRTRPMRAWLARIAINKARDWQRRRQVRRWFAFAAPLSSIVVDTVPDGAPGLDAVVHHRSELTRTLAAIASLPPNLKEPLILSALEDWSQSAIGDILGISEKAVETRIARARASLKASLDRAG